MNKEEYPELELNLEIISNNEDDKLTKLKEIIHITNQINSFNWDSLNSIDSSLNNIYTDLDEINEIIKDLKK